MSSNFEFSESSTAANFSSEKFSAQTWEIWGPERDESQAKSSLSGQRSSEDVDLRHFVAAILSSKSAKT